MEQTNDIDLLFISGRVSGTADLAYGADSHQSYVSTSADQSNDGLTPTARFDLGVVRSVQTTTTLRLPQVNLKENGSYWMQFKRDPTK